MNTDSKTAFIPDYKPFYIQASTDTTAKDTKTEWGLIAKSNPYPIIPTPKEPYKNDWFDENGDDEYVAAMKYQSIEVEVGFYIKCIDGTAIDAASRLRTEINNFFAHIKTGEFKIFDAYTGVGYQSVRYAGYQEDTFKSRGNWASCIFSVTFKVNDPITRITLNQSGELS